MFYPGKLSSTHNAPYPACVKLFSVMEIPDDLPHIPHLKKFTSMNGKITATKNRQDFPYRSYKSYNKTAATTISTSHITENIPEFSCTFPCTCIQKSVLPPGRSPTCPIPHPRQNCLSGRGNLRDIRRRPKALYRTYFRC